MDQYIYHRVFGSIITLSLISFYSVSSTWTLVEELPTHPELQIFYDLSPRYNTIWNLVFLCLYTSISLICDISTIRKRENDVHPFIRDFRFKIFHELIFPQVVNMIVYWPVFFYDRELVFPIVADVLVSPFGNFVFHGLGIIYVFLELIFLPQGVPKRTEVKSTYLLGLSAIYCVVVLYTRFVDLKVWVYGILTATEGTILFPFVFLSMFTLSCISFHGQWYVKDSVWKLRKIYKID